MRPYSLTLLTARMPDSARAEQQLRIRAREHSLSASWSVSGSVPYPSQQALRSIVVEGWTTTAVRRRLILIRQAMADRSSGRVHTAEDTIDAEKFREFANLIDEILPALELSADQRDHLKAGAAEIRAVACDPNTKPEALRQALEGVLRLQPTRSKPAQKVDKDKQ